MTTTQEIDLLTVYKVYVAGHFVGYEVHIGQKSYYADTRQGLMIIPGLFHAHYTGPNELEPLEKRQVRLCDE